MAGGRRPPPGPPGDEGPARIALKVDVCTRRGLDRGVPRLLELLGALGVRASFFVAMGPDRSGRALLRLLEPGFLKKLTRTRALGLYGLRTALSGTVLPARRSGAARPDLLRRIRDGGHEVGLHGWDHRRWQDRIDRLSEADRRRELDRAFAAFAGALGEPPRAFAAPAWTASAAALVDLDRRGLEYTSNTRGGPPFLPRVDGAELGTLEVPSTLPCPEEVLAADPAADPYPDLHAAGAGLHVFPAHAEVEGHPRHLEAFRLWLRRRLEEGARFVTLAEAAREALAAGPPPRRTIARAEIPGRPGAVLTGWPEALARAVASGA